MQAINHIATALVLKKTFPSAPLFGLILSVEAVEYLWVGLNLIGVERTIVDENMRSISDIHMEHMPFSHSIAGSILIATCVGMIFLWRQGSAARAAAFAMSLGVVSHIVLDLLVHAKDIEFAPYLGNDRFGSGLYAIYPIVALFMETCWGIACWHIYRGNRMLLVLIVILGIASIPFYSATLNAGEVALSGHPKTFALIILGQILITSILVWFLAKTDAAQIAGPNKA